MLFWPSWSGLGCVEWVEETGEGHLAWGPKATRAHRTLGHILQLLRKTQSCTGTCLSSQPGWHNVCLVPQLSLSVVCMLVLLLVSPGDSTPGIWPFFLFVWSSAELGCLSASAKMFHIQWWVTSHHLYSTCVLASLDERLHCQGEVLFSFLTVT